MQKRKQIWLSKFRIQKLMKIFAVIVMASSLVWIVTVKKMVVKPIGDMAINENLTKLEFLQNENASYTEILRRAAGKAFRSYVTRCLFEDEYRPMSNTCLSSYGFSATLLESVETLYILGMVEEYQQARDLIRDNFSCSNLGWVNRRELFSRGVGSLIGSYLITREKVFLQKASECTDRILSFNKEEMIPPFINIAKNMTRMRRWTKGTSIIEIASGLPELIALHILTNDDRYSMAYLSILSTLPEIAENETMFYPEYDLATKTETLNVTRLDGPVVGFLHNLVIANKIRPMKKLTELVGKSLENITLWTSDNSTMLYPLNEVYNHFEGKSDKDDVREFQSALQQRYFEDPMSLLAPGQTETYTGFSFEASVMRSDIDNPKILSTITTILQNLETETGFSGVKQTNMNQIAKTDIQHSSLMGEWLSLGAWIGAGKASYFDDSVFNERGHLLYAPKITGGEKLD